MALLIVTVTDRGRRPALRFTACAALSIAMWALAVAGVVTTHNIVTPYSVAVSVAVKVAVILVAGFAYVQVTRDCSFENTLAVGLAWIVFSIVAEVVISLNSSRVWFDLLGTPAMPIARDILLFTWAAAPALFARRRNGQ